VSQQLDAFGIAAPGIPRAVDEVTKAVGVNAARVDAQHVST
jgi:hypothetical protein